MTVLDFVPVERISEQARQAQFGRTIRVLIAALFYGLGWITSKTCVAAWAAVAFSAAAIKTGWVDARPARPPQVH